MSAITDATPSGPTPPCPIKPSFTAALPCRSAFFLCRRRSKMSSASGSASSASSMSTHSIGHGTPLSLAALTQMCRQPPRMIGFST